MKPTIFTGDPCDVWDEVQKHQHEPFIYIMSINSEWSGPRPDGIENLLEVLRAEPLDIGRFDGQFFNDDPCEGVRNPDFEFSNGEPCWIDGPRMYERDGVTRFYGNFLTMSNSFHIDTSHVPTIEALKAAILANVEGQQ